MNPDAGNSPAATASEGETYRLSAELVALGELRAAVDLMRRDVDRARRTLPEHSLMHLTLLSQYAGVLELTGAFGEAEFLRAKSVEIAESGRVGPQDAVEAFLKYGLLLTRNRNFGAAIPALKTAIEKAQGDLDGVSALEQQIVIAKAWQGLQQAYEGMGQLSEASEALDALDAIKRHIRYLVFARKR
jgi:tetratricopeptide (TPR) repeat protein